MPRVLVLYVYYINLLSAWTGRIFGFLIFMLLFILLFEAVMRYVFRLAVVWAIELSSFVLGTYFILGGAYALLRNAHVRMDALYNRWSVKRRAVVDLATACCGAVYLATFILGGIRDVRFSLTYGQHSASIWAPQLAPIKIIIVIGAVLLVLQLVAFFIRDISIVRGKPIE